MTSFFMAAVIEEKELGMRELMTTVFLFSGIFFLVTLLTFNLEDNGWTHSGVSTAPKNAGGVIGAWVSDLTFSLLGFEAYLFPLIIIWQGYLFYKQEFYNENALIITLRWLGLLISFIAGTVIFYLHVPRLIIELPNGSGGILGQEAGDTLLLILSESNTTTLSVSVFLLGISFFTRFSWFSLIDKIGQVTLWILNSIARLMFTGQKVPTANVKKKMLINQR